MKFYKNSLAKVLYGANGIACMFIGLLHILVHFQDLITDEVRTSLDQEILVSGNPANIWKLWQGMSMMMGYLLIVIGIFNVYILFKLKPNENPSVGVSLILMLMLIGVMYTGYFFFGSWQIYGGGAGFLLQSLCLYISLTHKEIR